MSIAVKRGLVFNFVLAALILVIFQLPAAADYSWQEFLVRQPGGVPVEGDTPWENNGGALVYKGTGTGSYVEDFMQTKEVFLPDNVRIEFDFRGSATTSQGYVGPVVLLAPDASQRKGVNAVTGNTGVIGAQAFYRWENAGTSGVYLSGGGVSRDLPNARFAGLNENSFSHHVITISGGKMTYQSDAMGTVELKLGSAWSNQVKMHLSVGVRYYDKGVPFTAEFKNIVVSSLEDTNSNNTVTGNCLDNATAFLQAVDSGDYGTALNMCSDGFQAENSASTLSNLRAFLNDGGPGTLQGADVRDEGKNASVSLFFTNSAGEHFSVHLSFKDSKIANIAGRWGR